MLQCSHLVKDYFTGGEIVRAVNDLSLTLRDCEFVSILGPSGCGKTTLLNIIGGLDQYTSGDLIINGKSTKDYTDKDWDTYRNHRVGFVFQSYNLIMHQTVLKNVEMSLILSGVSKEERRQRAIEALKKVGLESQIYKKPTQMSGGQMQRVAIARALVNDPEIVLADEPTGALDTKTSIQIMDLLKEIAKDRLVVMVTHNPELAQAYSTRIIELKDGKILSDSNPIQEEESDASHTSVALKKPSMSFWTALSLSFHNLMTKKGRTILTSFAGSIGIIGIGLIMSLSNGVQNYIDTVENDTMASYPITLKENSMNLSIMMEAMMDVHGIDEIVPEGNIGVSNMISSILNSFTEADANNLSAFKQYLESEQGAAFTQTAKAIEYEYTANMSVYNENSPYGITRISPSDLLEKLGFASSLASQEAMGVSSPMNAQLWQQLPEAQNLKDENYQLIQGSWPKNSNELLLAVNSENKITDYALYSLGLMDQQSLIENYQKVLNGENKKIEVPQTPVYEAKDFIGMELKVVPDSALYEKVGDVWIDRSEDEQFIQNMLSHSTSVKIVGIVKPADKTVSSTAMGGILYESNLRDELSNQAQNSAIVKEQQENPTRNVFTGQVFSQGEKFTLETLTPEQKMAMASMDQKAMMEYIETYNANANATYDSNLVKLGVIDHTVPSAIALYASSFDDKEKLGNLITDYNNLQEAEGKEENILSYTDTIGTMLSGVQKVIDMISYVLIGFVSVSLIVSSIMIGIITYISVLERIKEIGVLRAMGASKKDIRNVFLAETFIIGLTSGLLGIGITILVDLPISMVVQDLAGISNIASLPVAGALVLVIINMILTVIAGVIPAGMASKKNPVEALRSE